MTVLTVENLSIGYRRTAVATGIDLSLEAGAIACLLGPNGVGKTTLFKTLLGLIPALAGTVRIGGKPLPELSRAALARHIAYVPQAQIADFAYTVLDLVVMGRTAYLGAFGMPGKADFNVALEALETLGIAALADRDATRISGGQRQLALIARALAQRTHVIVMDEPTASLDLGNRLLVLDRIRALASEGLSILVSTHEPEQAFAVADSVAIMGSENRFITGPVETVLTSAELSRLYGIDLRIEATPSGRLVVGPASASPPPGR